MVHRRIQGMNKKGSCEVLGPYEVYNFCVQVKYLINFRAYKICMKKIPKNVQKNLVSLDIFLEDNMNMCKCFFHFSKNKVNLKLDNPLEDYMLNVKKVD